MNEQPAIVFNSDMWKDADRAIIAQAVEAVGSALAPFTGLDAAASFAQVFQRVRFRLTYGLRDHHGAPVSAYSQWDIVWFRPHLVTKELAIHELGHIFDQHILHGQASAALRDAKFPNAIFREGLTIRVHPEWQTIGFTAFERWAEVFMNWVLGAMAENEAGAELRQWVLLHMAEWLRRDECRVTMTGTV